jgi:hypothetical protein
VNADPSFIKAATPAQWHTHSPIHRVQADFSPMSKRPDHDADSSPPTSFIFLALQPIVGLYFAAL